MAKEALTIPPITETKSNTFREIYANYARLGITPWDLNILFGTLSDGVPNGAILETSVRVSPQQFKALVSSLNHILQAWEAAFGTVTVHSQFIVPAEIIAASMTPKPPSAPPTA